MMLKRQTARTRNGIATATSSMPGNVSRRFGLEPTPHRSHSPGRLMIWRAERPAKRTPSMGSLSYQRPRRQWPSRKENSYPDGRTPRNPENYYQDGSLQSVPGRRHIRFAYVYGVTGRRQRPYTNAPWIYGEIKLSSSGAEHQSARLISWTCWAALTRRVCRGLSTYPSTYPCTTMRANSPAGLIPTDHYALPVQCKGDWNTPL